MRSKSILLVILLMLLSVGAIYAFEILTIFEKSKAYILSQKANEIQITKNGLKEAKNIADALIATLSPKTPAAGLAAPQIGIAKQVFIFSWDRSMENIQVVINPKIIHLVKRLRKAGRLVFLRCRKKVSQKQQK